MRRSIGLIAAVLTAVLLPTSMTSAQQAKSRVVNTKPKPPVRRTLQGQQTVPTGQAAKPKPAVTVRTQETLEATSDEKRRAAAAHQVATAEEQQVAGRVRGLQLLMQKEEQALAQRLAYAAKVRAQGLAKNDQKFLDQAERLERQALDYYQKRVSQFENVKITPGTTSGTKAKSTRSTRSSSSQYRSSRSS